MHNPFQINKKGVGMPVAIAWQTGRRWVSHLHWRLRSRIRSPRAAIARLGTIVAWITVVAPPATYAWITFDQLQQRAEEQAALGARYVEVQLYQAIMRRELPGRDSAPVVSYMDVIRHGSVDQRIAVIATLTRNFRPVFAPGDAIFFDHMNLHRTGSRPEMTEPRFAVESWFFGPSAFPEGYTALAF